MQALLNAVTNFFRHPVAQRMPLNTAMRIVRWQVICRRQEAVNVHWIDGTRLIAQRGMTGLTGNIYYGLHEFHEMAAVLHILRPNDVFADVGANAGSYTVLAAGVVGARVDAFEPGSASANSLDRNILINKLQNRVRVHRMAVGAISGTALFIEGAGTMGRLSPDGERKVPVTTLDDVLTDPTIIKMDIEGGELNALKGAKKTLQSPSLRLIITESHGKEVVALMAEAGFSKFRYNAFSRRLTPLVTEDGNALFLRDAAAAEQLMREAGNVSVFGLNI